MARALMNALLIFILFFGGAWADVALCLHESGKSHLMGLHEVQQDDCHMGHCDDSVDLDSHELCLDSEDCTDLILSLLDEVFQNQQSLRDIIPDERVFSWVIDEPAFDFEKSICLAEYEILWPYYGGLPRIHPSVGVTILRV